MKYGKLKVTVDYGDGFTSETTYHAWSFDNEGTTVSALTDINAVDHAAQIHYDVDVTTNPQGIFGTASNVTYSWVEEPAIIGLFIEHGDNLDDYTEPGIYCRGESASDSSIVSNCPPMMYTSTFVLEVLPGGNSSQVIQRATRCHKTAQVVAERVFYSGSWGEWQTVSLGGQKVLWSGSSLMTANNTATFTDKASNQANGIVLVFSAYVDSKANDSAFHCFFVPKKQIELFSGKSHNFIMSNGVLTRFATKYLNIYDDKITGHSNNTATGTASGISFTNNAFVLRYVLGV